LKKVEIQEQIVLITFIGTMACGSVHPHTETGEQGRKIHLSNFVKLNCRKLLG